MSRPDAALEDLAARSLRQGNALRVRARGDSMLPFLLHGDVVLIRPVPLDEVRAGDVVCYEPCHGRLLVHRVVERHETRAVVRGDALAWADVVPLSAILGRAVSIERGGQTKRLDTRPARWTSRFAALASPALARLLPAALGLRRSWRALACSAR